MTTLAMNLPLLGRVFRADRADGSDAGLPPVLRRVVISVAALLLTLLLGRMALQRFDAPVRELVITGSLRHVQPDEVRLAAAPLLDAKLFELDLLDLRAAIERLPWVAHARVDRQWPARLAVRISEREPFARWGESDALSTEGVAFAPGSEALPATLPRLGGAPGRELEVMAMYGQLVDRLSETPFALAGLVQDARGEWSATTHSGITLRFGRSSPLEQVSQLKTIIQPALKARLDRVKSIDLRYANGFAVSWREPTGKPQSSNEPHNPPMSDAAPAEPASHGETP